MTGDVKAQFQLLMRDESSLRDLLASLPRKAVLGNKSLSRGFPDFQGSSRFLVGFADSIGRRRTMEDEMVVLGRGPRSLQGEDYFAVFDGHAGTEASALASRTLHVLVEKNLNHTPNVPQALKQSFLDTDAVMQKMNLHCGTCALVTFVQSMIRPVSTSVLLSA